VCDNISLCEVHLFVNPVSGKKDSLSLFIDRPYYLQEVCNTAIVKCGAHPVTKNFPSLSFLSEIEKMNPEHIKTIPSSSDNTPWIRKHINTVQSSSENTPWTTLPECSICLETSFTFSLSGCKHSFCTSCWTSHLTTQLSLNPLPILECPANACNGRVDLPTCVSLLLRTPTRHFWKTFLSSLAPRLGPSLCPHCKHFLSNPISSKCPQCHLSICVKCRGKHHWPANCEEWSQALVLSNTDTKLYKVDIHYRSCPQCGECWVKSHKWMWERPCGCNHMVCAKCRAEFCWGCGKGKDSHSGYYCRNYTPLEKKSMYVSDMLGLSSTRLEAIDSGWKKLESSLRNKTLNLQPKALVIKGMEVYEPRLWLQHSKRSSKRLVLLPLFARLETVVSQGLSILYQGRQVAQFGYFTVTAVAGDVQDLLIRLDISLQRLEDYLTNHRTGCTVKDWETRLTGLTQAVKMLIDKFVLITQ